ncbi:hypothetical protein ACW9IM_26490, partial [Pseudomonas pergaminensis]
KKCQQSRRLRSLAGARQLSQLIVVVAQIPPTQPIPCGSWLACDSGISGEKNATNAAAFAASPGLDSSHS